MRNKVKIIIRAGMIFLLSYLLFCGWGCKKEVDKAKKHYAQAVEYHQEEVPDKAIEELQKAIQIDSNYAEAHYELGILYEEKEDLRAAFQEFQEVIRINPDYAEAHLHLGTIYHRLRGYSQALTEYQEVQRIDPNFPRIHTAIGNVYYERGIRAWGRAITFNWSYLLPDTTKEITYKSRDDLIRALEGYIDSVDLDTTNAEAFHKLSQAYFLLAQEEYEKAIAVNSADTVAQLQLGLTFSERGYQNRAMEQYEVLKTLHPRAAETLLQVILHKEKDAEDLRKKGLR